MRRLTSYADSDPKARTFMAAARCVKGIGRHFPANLRVPWRVDGTFAAVQRVNSQVNTSLACASESKWPAERATAPGA